MKILSILVLFTPFGLFAQKKVVGNYRDHFGNRIQLYPDSTFKYTWQFDLSVSWTKGVWTARKDTIYFQTIPTFDTVSRMTAAGSPYDTLILSTDENAERFSAAQFAALPLSSGAQNRIANPKGYCLGKEDCTKFKMASWLQKNRKAFCQIRNGIRRSLSGMSEPTHNIGLLPWLRWATRRFLK